MTHAITLRLPARKCGCRWSAMIMRQHLVTATTNSDGIADITAELEDDLPVGDYQLQANVSWQHGPGGSTANNLGDAFVPHDAEHRQASLSARTDHPHARVVAGHRFAAAGGRTDRSAFAVRDAKGNKVFGEVGNQQANFGIAAADFKLASQVNEGSYAIAVTVGDTTSERNVTVERYVLPKFQSRSRSRSRILRSARHRRSDSRLQTTRSANPSPVPPSRFAPMSLSRSFVRSRRFRERRTTTVASRHNWR